MLKTFSAKQILILLALQTFLYLSAFTLVLFNEMSPVIKKWDSLIYSNISVEELDLSGRTTAEAESYLTSTYVEPIQNKRLFVQVGPHTHTLPLKRIIKATNLSTVLEEALQLGKSDSFFTKYQHVKYGVTKNYSLTFEYDEQAIADFVKSLNATLQTEVRDAKIQKGPKGKPEVIPSQTAYKLDQEKLIQQIHTTLSQKITDDLSITAPIEEIKPRYTTEYMQAATTKIASYFTLFPSTPDGRTENIRLSAEAINGTCLMPGEVFSFNEKVGETTREKGYQKAPIIANGSIIYGLGGGICQVSSTLYNAALLAGLNSLERRSHSKVSTYVPIGLDATVSYGSIDYKFKNTFDYPLYIEAYTDSNKVYVNLYSHSSFAHKNYVIESNIYRTLPSPVIYRYDSKLQPTDKVILQRGSVGYKVKSYRKLYEGTTLVSTEEIGDDTYRPSSTIYLVGEQK